MKHRYTYNLQTDVQSICGLKISRGELEEKMAKKTLEGG